MGMRTKAVIWIVHPLCKACHEKLKFLVLQTNVDSITILLHEELKMQSINVCTPGKNPYKLL